MEKLDGKSMDIVEQNIKQFKQLFPEVFSEGKIKFDQLQELLGNYIIKDEEHYNFTWHGKRAASRLAQTPSTGTLRPCKQESIDWDTTQNLFIEGDNLEVLKLLQKSYHRQVKMIYIDPPYNTGNDFVYKDDFKDGVQNYLEMTGQLDNEGKKIGTNSNSAGRYHTNWLNMMYPRLKLARNLLRDDGVIFISIDDNEQDNLKKLCNEIFGEENFIAQFAWRKTDNQANIGNIARVKEYIILYAKDSKILKLNKMRLTERAKKEYRYKDNHGTYRRSILLDKTRGRHFYKIKTPSGAALEGPWMINEKDFQDLCSKNAIYWATGKTELPYGKIYLHENQGQIANDFLSIEFGTNQEAGMALESLFNARYFDFPKPLSLIKHFLTIATNDDLILDFFAGSGTTAHAVMQLNAEDGGKRRCISVQLPEPTEKKSEAFKAGYKNIAEISKERLRRAGKKIKEEQSKKLNLNANGDLDTGFKVFKLDSSNIKRWEADFDTLDMNLLNAVDHLKQDRSNEDLLYEILLKYGLDLAVPIETRTTAGKNIYIIGRGALIVCLDEDIDMDLVQGITSLKEELPSEVIRVVFKDSSFRDDNVKTNALMNLKRYGFTDIKSL
ncbi:site-specific DNA-methyltransferase [Bartonella krasnovii]|uniref:site-specific DNA-methyltransferase n=1 Tax=Bartonella krasnovii TaxID=2267275 RepID=UPI001F4D04D6|nr:site-specific DNA-methyltransferase [Bartonella krasnovii]UNF35039.1 site-specific DNA-methyltransferase [Bartonella krasnovii]UNF48212.1 site-specific DNA-methyltransferase [Bartonella krasnovii]